MMSRDLGHRKEAELLDAEPMKNSPEYRKAMSTLKGAREAKDGLLNGKRLLVGSSV
jgi:hypothetical protein